MMMMYLYLYSNKRQGLQGRRQEERAILSPLAGGIQTLQLIPGQQYKLVPTVFMDHWRSYMNQGGRTGNKLKTSSCYCENNDVSYEQ